MKTILNVTLEPAEHGTKWTLENAVDLIRALQPVAHKYGYHLALAGGVLNKGYSDKDLDIVALPRTEMEQDWPDFEDEAEDVIGIPLARVRPPDSAYPLTFQVYRGKHRNGGLDLIRHESQR